MRVLVATDGSADSRQAIAWLEHLPLPADASVEVVSVLPRPIFDESRVRTPWSALRTQMERALEEARGQLAKRWPGVTARVLYGDAREAIVDAAYRAGVHLIVLGARGLGTVASFLLGSVSLGVARHASCAVLVCRGPARPVRRVTIGVDGSPDAAAALTFFASLPLPADLGVRVVGVVQPLGLYASSAPEMTSSALIAGLRTYEDALRAELEPALRDAAEMLGPRVRSVAIATPVGAPADMLLKDAAASEADLIVVGARGKGPLKRMLLGSVSESVLHHAGCPVLIERRPQ
jgi:nucleotide-binding universal stress UspA family protein